MASHSRSGQFEVNLAEPKDGVTCIQVSVSHISGCYRLGVYPAEIRGGSVLVHITQGACTTLELAPRYNARKLATWVELAKAVIKNRANGPIWNYVEDFLSKNGYTLA